MTCARNSWGNCTGDDPGRGDPRHGDRYGTEIREAGLGNQDLAQILNNKYYKYTPSKPAINDAYRNHPERYTNFYVHLGKHLP
jgi:hypothetical protein